MKKIVTIIALVLLLPVAYFGFNITQVVYNSYPPEIVNYSPTDFTVKSKIKFFYTIGNELRYGSLLSKAEPIIYSSDKALTDAHVSPNSKFVAIVSNNELRVVSSDGHLNKFITNVRSSLKSSQMPIGERFFDAFRLQWSKDSSSIYILQKEVFKRQSSSYIGSKYRSLYQYNLTNEELREVVHPLPNSNYFFDNNGTYYVVSTDVGNLILKYSTKLDNSTFVDMGSLQQIQTEKEVFYNFTIHDYERKLVFEDKIKTKISDDREYITYLINGKGALVAKKGAGLKGAYFGIGIGGSQGIRNAFTPDYKYFLLNVTSSQFSGQLLFDTESLKYKTLPQKTRIYQNVNTFTSENWLINQFGIQIKRKNK